MPIVTGWQRGSYAHCLRASSHCLYAHCKCLLSWPYCKSLLLIHWQGLYAHCKRESERESMGILYVSGSVFRPLYLSVYKRERNSEWNSTFLLYRERYFCDRETETDIQTFQELITISITISRTDTDIERHWYSSCTNLVKETFIFSACYFLKIPY